MRRWVRPSGPGWRADRTRSCGSGPPRPGSSARGAVCGRVRSLPTGRGAARDPSTSGPDPSGDPGWAPDRGQPGGGAAAAGDRAARPTRPSPPREARRRSRGGSRGRPPPRPRQAMIRVGRSCSSSTWKRMRLARPRPVGDITLAVPTEASRGSGYSLLAWPRRQQPDRRALPQAVAELAQWRGNCGPGPTRSAPDLGRPLRSTGSDHVASSSWVLAPMVVRRFGVLMVAAAMGRPDDALVRDPTSQSCLGWGRPGGPRPPAAGGCRLARARPPRWRGAGGRRRRAWTGGS